MTEYNSIESVFLNYFNDMNKYFPKKIRSDIDYISLLCHDEIDEKNEIVKTHFDYVIEKFIEPIKKLYPKFDNYIIDFVLCILYYNELLTPNNFRDALQIFNDDIEHLNDNNYRSKYNKMIFKLAADNLYLIGTDVETQLFKNDIFNFNL